MANIKKIKIGDKEYTLKMNALLPRRYRAEFGKDVITELNNLLTKLQSGEDASWEVAENLTYMMIKAAGVDEIGTIDEWLEGVDDTLAIQTSFADVITMWKDNQDTTSVPRKK